MMIVVVFSKFVPKFILGKKKKKNSILWQSSSFFPLHALRGLIELTPAVRATCITNFMLD